MKFSQRLARGHRAQIDPSTKGASLLLHFLSEKKHGGYVSTAPAASYTFKIEDNSPAKTVSVMSILARLDAADAQKATNKEGSYSK